MKRIIICFLLFFAINLFSLNFWFTESILGYVWNDTLERMEETKITIYYRQDQEYTAYEMRNKREKEITKRGDLIQLFFVGSITRNRLTIIPENRTKIFEIINKYKEWNEKAISEKVKIEKEIDRITYSLAWHSIYNTDDWYYSVDDIIYFTFFSQSETHHQLVLVFSKDQDVSNNFIDNKPETLYLNHDNVLLLEKFLSDDYIQKQIEIAEKQKEKEDMFK